MALKIPFLKMSGAGNDFIVIDNRAGIVPEPASALAARLCARRDAIGADGMLLLERSGRVDFRMRYFNADGSEAEMCGNGARCISRFALLCGAAKAGWVALDMPAPHSEALSLRIEQDGLDLLGHSLNTGVPHLVLEWPGLSAAPVVSLGRKLRHHAAFAPKGTNVNFVEVTGPQSLDIRTYERGVEDETLACGTGSVAAAILMARAGRVKGPVTLTTASGSKLEVRFSLAGGQALSVQLIGDARVRFAGEFEPFEFGS